MRKTILIEGSLTTVTPFANSPEGCVGRNKERLLPRMPINVGGSWVDTAYIPAATLRGRIRRAAAHVVRERFEIGGETITFDDWLLWSVGGVKGDERERNLSPTVRQSIIDTSPLLSMFGAGASPAGFVAGQFCIQPGLPSEDVPVVMVEGARAAEHRNVELAEILPETEMERVHLYTLANTERADLVTEIKNKKREFGAARKKDDPDEANRLEGEIAELEQQLTEAEQAQRKIGSINAIGRPLPGYEVIPPGVVFQHTMMIRHGLSEHVGFALCALEQFALEPRIGAHAAAGCGYMAGDYDVKLMPQAREERPRHIGRLRFSPGSGLSLEGEELQELVEAWEKHDFQADAWRAELKFAA
jgi:CRISPR type IV-associated protein Csf2